MCWCVPASACRVRQDVTECCGVNTYGPSGPFAAKPGNAYSAEATTSWPRASKAVEVPTMTGTWCTWAPAGNITNSTMGIDLNTGIAPVGLVDGIW